MSIKVAAGGLWHTEFILGNVKIYLWMLTWLRLLKSFLVEDKDPLTHLPLVPHICIKELDQYWFGNGLSPEWRQAIIWTNAAFMSIRPSGTNFSEILIKIQNFLFMEMHLKMTSAKLRPWGRWVMHQRTGSTLVQVTACRLYGAKPLSEPMLPSCQLDPQEQNSVKF